MNWKRVLIPPLIVIGVLVLLRPMLFGLVLFAVGMFAYAYIAWRRGLNWMAIGAIVLGAVFLLLAVLGWGGFYGAGAAIAWVGAWFLFNIIFYGGIAYILWRASNELTQQTRWLKPALRIIAVVIALPIVVAPIEYLVG